MRGVGGPLLCIGDLLNDVDTDDAGDAGHRDSSPPSPAFVAGDPLRPSRLRDLFEGNYNQLVDSLAEKDHSWTASTLKLCGALKTADKLISTANADAGLLLEKVGMLENLMQRGDAAVEAGNAVLLYFQTAKAEPSIDSMNAERRR